MTRRSFLLVVSSVALGLGLVSALPRAPVRTAELPSRLSDGEFWRIVTDFSEPNGYFRSDNLTSNELGFQAVIPDLIRRTRPGGVYLGVGPEQNFTYIVAVRPAIAIVFDIRRGNMLLQLMYKALIELAKDRADFVSKLFAKPRPAGLGPASTAGDLFGAFAVSDTSDALYAGNLTAIKQHLTKTHSFRLSSDDLSGIEAIYRVFYLRGFAVRPWPSYADLMTQTDGLGGSRSYLASESGFALLKRLESQNLIIPVVGDFAGSKAIRAVGAYLKARRATVTAFYLSNVEQFLYQDRKWTAFCRNVATLPLDSSSTFIRSSSGGFGYGGRQFVSSLGPMAAEVAACRGF
jgi:hypothetical protein